MHLNDENPYRLVETALADHIQL